MRLGPIILSLLGMPPLKVITAGPLAFRFTVFPVLWFVSVRKRGPAVIELVAN